MNYNDLWVEKYRPKTLKDLLLSSEVRDFFQAINDGENKNIPHCLFIGEPGGGKSSLSMVIVNDILKCQYLYINASDETGVDIIRGKVTNFIQTKSIDGGVKVVILDEFEGMSKEAQKSLRNIIEEYTDYARFILTSNYIHKVIEPIVSRCSGGLFFIQPDRKDFNKRCINILREENIIITPEQTPNLLKLLGMCYPDLRRALHTLQKFSITGTFIFSEKDLNKEVVEIATTCFNSIKEKKNIFELRAYVIANEKKFNMDYQILLKELFEIFYNDLVLDLHNKRVVLLIIADAMCDDVTVLDHEINYFSTMIKIEQILNELPSD